MELRLPTEKQLKTVYHTDLKASFPPAELKPLSAIQAHLEMGRYLPYCLFDGDDIAGECFLWQVEPDWALLDYLCVSPRRRNAGLGALLLEKLRQARPELTVFGEAEVPEDAPEPALAARRLNFYRRCGAAFADFTSEVFGVPYRIFYWSPRPVEEGTLLRHYDAVYRESFPPDKYARYIRIPRTPGRRPQPRTPWSE